MGVELWVWSARQEKWFLIDVYVNEESAMDDYDDIHVMRFGKWHIRRTQSIVSR